MSTLDSQPISGNLLKIDGLTIPELATYKVQENKLWKDSNRNMNGDMRATLIGIFPKLMLTFTYMNRDRMAQVAAKLNKDFFDVTYFNPVTATTRTAQFYAGDFTIELFDKSRGLYKPTDVDLIAMSRA